MAKYIVLAVNDEGEVLDVETLTKKDPAFSDWATAVHWAAQQAEQYAGVTFLPLPVEATVAYILKATGFNPRPH